MLDFDAGPHLRGKYEVARDTSSAGVSAWLAFAAGAILALIIVALTVALPIAEELSRLAERVAQLDKNLQAVADQTKTAERGNALLAELTEQGKLSVGAADALAKIHALHQRLDRETRQVERAVAGLEKLTLLKDRILEKIPQLDDAATSLSQIVNLNTRLVDEQARTIQARQALDNLKRIGDQAIELMPATDQALGYFDQFRQLQDRVIGQWHGLYEQWITARDKTDKAREASQDLLALQSDLTNLSEGREEARTTLNGLVEIRRQLDANGSDLSDTQQRVESLLTIKDTIVSRTSNLADAIETLELTTDLNSQLEAAIQSYQRMRHAMVEIIAFEPAIHRALTTLQPLVALGDLRHLAPDELRSVARTIRDERNGTATSNAALSPQPTDRTGARSSSESSAKK